MSQSGSHSEKYRLELTPVSSGGVAASELPRVISWVDAKYGVCETKTALLMRGCGYELRMFHAGTREGDESDYDYSLSVSHPQGAGVIVSDPASSTTCRGSSIRNRLGKKKGLTHKFK